MASGFVRTLISASGFVLLVALWSAMMNRQFETGTSLFLTVGCPLLVLPVSLAGRRLLDWKPTSARAAWVNTVFHLIFMLLFGSSIFEGIKTVPWWPGEILPFPRALSFVLVTAGSIVTALTILNLALRGLGAPFAVFLSRRLAVDWFYRRTRNPMILATLVTLFALGLWYQSLLFIVWVVLLVAPSWIFMVKVYEERELEIRFGDAYREYRSRTPLLWPRLP